MLKFLIIFIGIVYIVGYIGRLLIGQWLKKMQNPNQFQNKQQQVRPEGEVFVKKTTDNKKHFNIDDGEYVDYEEVK